MSASPVSPRDQEREHIRDLLGTNVLFGCLSETDRWALSEFIGFRTLAKDDVLFNAGDPADSLFVVVQGRVVPTDFVFTFANDAGDVVGEVWLFSDGHDHTRHSGAKAEVENTVVLHVPFSALERLLTNAPFLLALVRRHQRYTHWNLHERVMRGTGRIVAAVEVPGAGEQG